MSHKRILIVEDEVRSSTLMKKYLACLGPNYQVETVATGDEALRSFEQEPWDLVVTDNCMPGLTGLELIAKIKQKNPSALTVLMTGFGSEEVEQAARQLQVLHYLLKPFPMTDLRRVIEDALPQPQEPAPPTPQPGETTAYKVVLAGDGFVGKTTLIKRLCTGEFDASRKMTVGVDFHLYDIKEQNSRVRLIVWDVSGQDHFAFTRLAFYRGSRAVGLVYSVDARASFERLSKWKQEIRNLLPNVPLIIVGNKSDLNREVTTEQGQQLAREWNAPFFETSCVDGSSVQDFFITLSQMAEQYAAQSSISKKE